MTDKKVIVVIKLSGKVFGMDNADLLRAHARMLAKLSKRGYLPVVVAGGGSIARHYISHARSSGADEATLDELGIEISRLNARLMICALKNTAYPRPPTTLTEVRHAVDDGRIVVTGGLQPGQSTNGTAALIAEKIGAAQFLNATDVDGVYDMDPNKFKQAKRFNSIGLRELRSILVQEDSVAGGYDLMDILALKIIERSRIKTIILKAEPSAIEEILLGDDKAGHRDTSTGTKIILSPK